MQPASLDTAVPPRVVNELAVSDERLLVRFLSEHWRRDHVFVRRSDLLHWQHRTADGSALRFVCAVDAGGETLSGLLGVMPLSHFDANLGAGDYFLGIWKVKENASPKGLGISLFQSFQRHYRPRSTIVLGLSLSVIPLYQAMGFQVGWLQHFVRFRSSRYVSRIAAPPSAAEEWHGVECSPVSFLELSQTNAEESLIRAIDLAGTQQTPQKTFAYIKNRYLDHPYYDYRVSVAIQDDKVVAVVWRKLSVEGSAVLRIVDLIGDPGLLRVAAADFERLLVEESAEYIDVVFHGLDEAALRDCGFIDRREHPELVIPNYFEPFERRNVEVAFGYKYDARTCPPVRILRGDSDQDRPNLLEAAPERIAC
jgi:hypothetical protein